MPTPIVPQLIRELGIVAYGLGAVYMLLRAGIGLAYASTGLAPWVRYLYALSKLAFAGTFTCLTLIAIVPAGMDGTPLVIAARISALVGAGLGIVSFILNLRKEWQYEQNAGDNDLM